MQVKRSVIVNLCNRLSKKSALNCLKNIFQFVIKSL